MAEPVAFVRRVLPAPPEVVFAAWTDAAGMRQWMSPVGTASMAMDLRVGGSFRLVMSGPGLDIEHSGEYLAIEPPSLLSFSWRSEFTAGRETLVTVRLAPYGQSETELTLTHELLTEDQARSHEGGWGGILDRLAEHLSGR